MRKIQQANDLSTLLQDLHGVEVTPCELLELEDYNYTLAHQKGGGLATNNLYDINNDVGKAIGFIVGAVLGAFILPGLGFGITGWLAGAVAGGALGYRLVSLFDGSGASGQNNNLIDATTRFSGAGELGQLGADIPIIYGNKDINPSGGCVVRNPTLIYSRITTGQGVEYLERLSLLTVGRLGRVNLPQTLYNDQRLSSIDAVVEVSTGYAVQKALGNIDNYSQSITPSLSNTVGLKKLLTIRANVTARGAANSATNIVGCSGTGTAAIVKTAAGGAWNAGFNSAALTTAATIGSYIFNRFVITGTAPIRLAAGFSINNNATTDPLLMDVYVQLDGTNWQIKELGDIRASGSSALIVPNATIELRSYYRGANSMWVQLFVGTVEIGRVKMDFNQTTFSPDYSLFSAGSGIGVRSVGAIAQLATAGNVVPTLGTVIPVEIASISKLQLGKTYTGSGEGFTVVAVDAVGGTITVNPEVWVADIAGWTGLGSWIASGSQLSESYLAEYTTSKAVTSLEAVLTYQMWGRNASNAQVVFAQGFTLVLTNVATAAESILGTYLLRGSTETTKSTTVAITNLPKAAYKLSLKPLDGATIVASVNEIEVGQPKAGLTGLTVGGNAVTIIIERKAILTAAVARTALNAIPAASVVDKGAGIQLASVNEIVNPFGMLTAPASSVPVGTGTGLTATYNNRNTSNGAVILPSLISRTEATINITSGGITGVPGLTPNSFYALWEGTVIPRYSTTYQFRSTHDDGARVIVNDKLLVNDYTSGTSRSSAGSIDLAAGVEYPIRVEYFNGAGSGAMKLEWSSSFFAWQIVEKEQLKPTAPSTAVVDLAAPTYPGYTITRTKLTSSDKLSSAPGEAFDVELGAVIRQYLGYGAATAASTDGTVTASSNPFNAVDIPIGAIVRVLRKGTMMITATPTASALTCAPISGTCFPATTDSLLILDFALWSQVQEGMVITGVGIPSKTYIAQKLPQNRIQLSDEWGRQVKATVIGTPSLVSVVVNPSVAVAVGDEIVVYTMGSSPYFPDQYVDRLINPISGLGAYIDGDRSIDYKSIIYARQFCKTKQFYCDGRFAGQKFEAWAIQTAPSSLLFCSEINGKYALLAQEDSKPVYLFNDTNCDYTEPGVPFLSQLTNTLLVKYQDRLGREKQIKIQTTAANNGAAEVVQSITAPGVTRREQAIAVGQVALKSLILQSSVCTITTDVAVGLYVRVSDIIRTQHRAIEYSDELSGFVMAVAATTNTRTTSRAIAIDRIEGFNLITAEKHQLLLVANDQTAETLVITGNSEATNNIALPTTTKIINERRLSVSLALPGTGGILTATRTIFDQQVTLSEPVSINVNSRLIVTHRGSRLTESDLLVTQVSANVITVIGLSEAIQVGDVWAVGSQSNFYKTWRVSATKPAIENNEIVITGISWSSEILTATGLVTVG